jgi:hypothetical protein
MSLPPLPWSYQTNSPAGKHEGSGFVYLIDANGRKIAALWGNPEEKIASAQFIIEASDQAHVTRARRAFTDH